MVLSITIFVGFLILWSTPLWLDPASIRILGNAILGTILFAFMAVFVFKIVGPRLSRSLTLDNEANWL